MFAALPPLAEAIREIDAILVDPKFYELLGSAENIEEIRHCESGYQVVTTHYTVQVDVVYRPSGERCGPVDFELIIQMPVPRM